MQTKRAGRQTVQLSHPPSVVSFANIGGRMEGQGPLSDYFDELSPDAFFGKKTWEQGESAMQERVLRRALEKGGLTAGELDYVLAGDLLNQCIGTSFGLRSFHIPFYGLYGACSTMGESLSLAALLIDGGFARLAAAMTSSHYCTAERQYRMPVPYGSQRTPTAQWTATAAGAAVLEKGEVGPFVRAVTIGTIEDLGITDANNMGAAMAPAAAMTLKHFFEDTGTNPSNYDLIITGDLGKVGTDLLRELTLKDGYDLEHHHTDCGLMLYDLEKQDVHAGASGCGCSASVMCGHILPLIRRGTLNEILFVATGALMSPTVVQQGESIASIAHLVYLSSKKTGGRV